MSFLEPVGSTFASRGGLTALDRRAAQFQQMQQVAVKTGLMQQGEEAPDPTGFKGMFFRVVDFISRPNYAIAGIADTLQGTGKEGEYAMVRALRELGSGLPGVEGEKEVWSDVLEQRGVGEMGNLSDLIGENGLTRNFNPTTRDAVGLALDIFTDPLTFISAPVKNASIVFGAGGEVRFLNKAGRAARAAKYEQKLEHWRGVLSMPDNASELQILDRIGTADQFRKAQTKVTSSIVQAGDNFGRAEVQMVLNRQAGEELLAESVATGGRQLFEKTGLRFRPLPGVDIPVGIDKAIARTSSVMWEGMKRTDMGARVAAFGEETMLALDKVFNHVPFLARKNQRYYQHRQFQHMRHSAAEHVAKLEAQELMTGVHKGLWEDRDLWRYFVRALEMNDSRADNLWVQMGKRKGIDNPQAFMDGWRATFDRVGTVELGAGFMTEAQYAATQARYFHRIIDRFDSKIRKKVNVSARQGSTRPGLGGAQHEARALEKWTDFEKHMKSLGATDDQIVLNPFEVAATRLRLHYEDMATASFLDELEPLFGFKTTQTHKRMTEILTKAGRESDLADTQLRQLEEIESRSSTINPDGYETALQKELERIARESDEGQAVSAIESMIDGLTEEMDPVLKRLEVEKATDEWRRIQRAYRVADHFDLHQGEKASRAEITLHRQLRTDLKKQEQYLRKWARSFRKEAETIQKADEILPEGAIIYRTIEGTEVRFDPFGEFAEASPTFGKSVFGEARIPATFSNEEAKQLRRMRDLAERRRAIDENLARPRGGKAISKAEARVYKEEAKRLEKELRELEASIRKSQKEAFERGPQGALKRAQDKVDSIKQQIRDRKGRARNYQRAGQEGRAAQLLRSAKALEENDLTRALQKIQDARAGLREARSFGKRSRPVSTAETQRLADQARASMHLFDEAMERADEWDDVLTQLRDRNKVAKEEVDAMRATTRENLKVVRDAYKAYWKEFEEQVVRDVTGDNVQNLLKQQKWLSDEITKLEKVRDDWITKKVAAKQEVEKVDYIFNPLKSRIKLLSERKKLLSAKRTTARKDLVEAKKIFRDANPTSAKQLKAQDMATLKAMPKHVQAAFLLRSVEQISDIKHLENFMSKYSEILHDVDTELTELANKLAPSGTADLVDQYGQAYQTISIRTSPRLKETINEDKAIAEAVAYREQISDQLDALKAEQKAINDSLKKQRADGLEITDAMKDEKKLVDAAVKEAREMKKNARQDWLAAKRARASVPSFGGNKEFYLPQGIVDDLKNLEGVLLENEEIRHLLGMFDRLNNFFKLAVTRYFMSFHIRNMYSNVAASFTDIGMEALNPVRAKQAMDILRGADGTFTTNTNKKIPYSMIRDEIDVLNMNVDKSWLAEQTGVARVRPQDPVEWVIDKGLRREGVVEGASKGLKKMWSVPMSVENHARIMHFIALRRRGYTMQDAAMQVNKFLFDYQALSATERGVFRRLFPFWTWARKNAERQIRNLYENPGRIATQTKVFAGDRGPDGELLPEYMRGQLNSKIRSGPDGEVWLTNMDLPIANLDILWAGGFGKTFKEQIGMLTPILKTPMEIGSGQEFFTGQSLRGVGRIRPDLGNALSRNLPKAIEDYFELKNVGTKEDPNWRINRLKFHIVTQTTFISRLVSETTRFDQFVQDLGNGDAAEGAKMALRILSGINLRSYDMEEKHRAELYNKARRLENMLVNRGRMESFERPYIPKRVKEEVGLPAGRQRGSSTTNPFGGGGGGF